MYDPTVLESTSVKLMVIVHYAILGSCYPPMSFGDIGESSLYLFPLTTKTVVKLLEPSGRQKGSVSLKARSTKTEQLQRNPEYTSKQSLAPPTNISCFLRDLNIFATYRHAWALVRKTRPDVVVIEGLKLPNPAKV